MDLRLLKRETERYLLNQEHPIKFLIMKTFIVLLVALVAITEAVFDDEAILREWNTFKVDNQKVYETEAEEKYRKNIFMENKHQISVHNSKYEQGLVSFKLRLNKYADLSHEEFMRTMTGYKPEMSNDRKNPVGAKFVVPSSDEVPNNMDWRKKGAVTIVKDQGQCGACWAFTATGALEGQHFIKTGKLLMLSEQNLVECTLSYGNQGCAGGTHNAAFRYVISNKGIATEAYYPYNALVHHPCHYDPKYKGESATDLVNISTYDEEELKAAVGTAGPVAAAIDGSPNSFRFYSSGLYSDPNCSPDNLNHGVLVVGYGTDENGKDYWLVKNSWSPNWGDQGYMKMARHNNQCGIASRASYPVI